MAITSQITLKPLIGTNPVGHIDFPNIPNPPQNYIGLHRVTVELDELTAFTVVTDPVQNQNGLMTAVKTYLDTEYANTNYTDANKDYFVDYTVVNIKRTYKASSSSIWTLRDYVWIVDVNIRVMTDY